MGILDFIARGGEKISVKNCSRDERDPRVTRCKINVTEDGGVVRSGEIDVIGNNKTIFPLSKSGNLSDRDFDDTVNFLRRGGWPVIVPRIQDGAGAEE